MYSAQEQKKHCLLLARHLELAITDEQYAASMMVVPLSHGIICGNALAHAADLGIGGLGLTWVTPRRACIIKDHGIMPDHATLESIFGKGVQFEMFWSLDKTETIRAIRAFAASIHD